MTSIRRLAVLLLASGLLLTPGLGTTASAAQSGHEKNVIKLVNAERAERDRVTLKSQRCLQRYADSWARSMALKQSLQHRSSSSLRRVMSTCKLRGIGENIAYGYGSSRAVVNAWMDSPGHRANILRSSYRRTGVGAYRDADGRLYHAQLFGTPR